MFIVGYAIRHIPSPSASHHLVKVISKQRTEGFAGAKQAHQITPTTFKLWMALEVAKDAYPCQWGFYFLSLDLC
jgi:hypothetical protein